MGKIISGNWKIAKQPTRVLVLVGMVGSGLVAWLPKELEVLRVIGFACGMFASGMLSAQHAAIWAPALDQQETETTQDEKSSSDAT